MKKLLLSLFLLQLTFLNGKVSKPNIIYIIVDDMGYSDLGSFGGEIDTPRIDQLASEGIRFRQHYTFAKCETSRTAMLSGMFHNKAGLKLNPESGAKSAAEILKQAGYTTAISGKWHMDLKINGKKQHPLDRGFDYFYGLKIGSNYFFNPADNAVWENRKSFTLKELLTEDPDYYMTDAIADKAIGFINRTHANNKETGKDQPFFLYLAFNAPHTPLQAPSALIKKYQTQTNYAEKGWDKIRENRYKKQIDLGIVDPKWKLSESPDHLPNWDNFTEKEKEIEGFRMSVYAAMIDRMDTKIGDLLDELERLGIRDNTLIYFVSDNGASPYDLLTAKQHMDMIVDERARTIKSNRVAHRMRPGAGWSWVSNTPFRYYKQHQYNGGVMTPMIVSWPAKIKQLGTISDFPTHIMDAVPTMADIAGLSQKDFPNSPTWDGISLKSIFLENKEPARNNFALEFQRQEFGYLSYPWKITSYRGGRWKLYNLEDDRSETNDLSIERTDIINKLAAEYTVWMKDKNDFIASNAAKIVKNFDGTSKTISNHNLINFRNHQGKIAYQTDPQFKVAQIGQVSVQKFDTDITKQGQWTLTHQASKIGGTKDSFTFAYKELSGKKSSTEIRLDSFGATGGTHRRAGLMYRATTAPDSPFAFLEVNHNANKPVIQWRFRTAAGKNAQLVPIAKNISFPIWLKLVEENNQYIGYYSTDGRNWTETKLPSNTGVQNTEMSLTGVALCSQSEKDKVSTFTFSSPSVIATD